MKNRINILIAGLFMGLFILGQANAQRMHNQDEKKSQTGTMMQQGMMGQGMHQGFGFYLNRASKLDLTEEQATQLREMKFEFKKANIKRKSALQLAQIELQQLKAAEKIDTGKIDGKIREVHSKQAEIETALFQAKQNAKAVLTDEQKAKIKDMACSMCGQMHEGGMMGQNGMMQGMMGQDGMAQQGQQKDNAAQHEQHHKKN